MDKRTSYKAPNNKNINNIITPHMLSFLKCSLNHNPFQTQFILQNKINNKFNINVSLFTIRKMMAIIGYTKKKVSRKLYNADIKKHKLSRKNFEKKIKKINKNDIICIDEVCTTKDTFNNYGYCHKSKRLQYFVDSKQLPQKRSIIVAISNNEVIHYKIIVNGNANKEIFLEFIYELCSKVNNKILLMDNVKFHTNDDVKNIIQMTNNERLFIPPYSPEYNPIEEVFSLFKSFLRRKINIITGFINLDKYINYFFTNSKNFNNYYSHSFD